MANQTVPPMGSTSLCLEWQECVRTASPPLKRAAQAIVDVVEDHWPDDEHPRFYYSLSMAQNRLSIPRLLTEQLSSHDCLKDRTVYKIINSIKSMDTFLTAIHDLDEHRFNNFHCKNPVQTIDVGDVWEEPTLQPTQEEADIKCLSSFLSLLLDQFSKKSFTTTAFDTCTHCHRMFIATHRGRRYCAMHQPKSNRATYDKARKLIISPPGQNASVAIQQACNIAFQANNPNTIINSLHHLPATSSMLAGIEKEPDLKSFILFIIHRLDVLSDPELEDDLVSWLHHPGELSQLLYMHEAHANSCLPAQKKRGRKALIDPELASRIRGHKPNRKTFQEVADILAKDYKKFATRQAVSQAIKKS
ncbi:MAG: hypothetical protein RQ867_07645 [Mariprofundaceae bacterium]|nr:hypothetical protein [Mariprofundaceae bacterium]